MMIEMEMCGCEFMFVGTCYVVSHTCSVNSTKDKIENEAHNELW